MSLSALIRKREPLVSATATLATVATHQAISGPTVASVATVAVASGNLAESDKSFRAFRWMALFADREPVEGTFSPMATLAEVLADWPGAVAAEPMSEPSRRSATNDESAELRGLVAAIYQDDTDGERNEALATLLTTPHNDAAIESARGPGIPDDDDRHPCCQCANLTHGGTCAVATPGGAPSAQRAYRPGAVFQSLPHRCDGFEMRGISEWSG